MVVLLVIPMLQNVYYSFFDWNGLSAPLFNGLKNYVDHVHRPRDCPLHAEHGALGGLHPGASPPSGGLLVAVFVTGLRGEGFFKSIFFIPLTISFVATGVIWAYMLSKELGVLNGAARLLGIPAEAVLAHRRFP